MYEGDSIWKRKGATLSDKSVRQESGLTQQEIIAAIRHYKGKEYTVLGVARRQRYDGGRFFRS